MAIDKITASGLGDGGVSTADIADDAVTSAKLDTNIAITGDLTVDTNTLHVDSANNKVGFGIDPGTLPSFVNHAVLISNGGGISVTSSSAGDNRYIFFGNGTSSSDIQLAAIQNTNSDLIFKGASGSEKMRILNAGGITFNGDTAAANALDDYEEGDFTPTLTPGGGSYNGLTLTGKYTKIGRLVTIQMNLTITASGNASGSATVSNLPFASVGSWNRMPNKWRENQATGVAGQFVMNQGQASGFMQNDDGSNIAHTTGRVYLINAMYYSA